MILNLAPGARFTMADGRSVFRTELDMNNMFNRLSRRLSDSSSRPSLSGKKANRPVARDGKPRAIDREACIRAEERERLSDVFASQHINGRFAAAVELIVSSDMSAEKIVAMLPKLGAITVGSGGKDGSQQNHGWGRVTAKLTAHRSEDCDQGNNRRQIAHSWGRAVAAVNARNKSR